MDVKYLPPSELDGEVRCAADSGGVVEIRPRFFTRKGDAVVGQFIVKDVHGTPLDRVIITVTGSGKLKLSTRHAEVKPLADEETGGTEES